MNGQEFKNAVNNLADQQPPTIDGDSAPHPLEAMLPEMLILFKTAVDNGTRQATALNDLALAINRLASAIESQDETATAPPLPPEAVAFLKDQAAPQPPVESAPAPRLSHVPGIEVNTAPTVFKNPPLFVAH